MSRQYKMMMMLGSLFLVLTLALTGCGGEEEDVQPDIGIEQEEGMEGGEGMEGEEGMMEGEEGMEGGEDMEGGEEGTDQGQ